MSAKTNNKNWWRLENVDNLVDENGLDNLTKFGTPTNQVAKYGNGVYNNVGTNSLRKVGYTADINRFAVGQWVKLDYNIVAGVPSTGGGKYYFTAKNSSDNLFILGFALSAATTVMWIRVSAAHFFFNSVNLNMTAGVWYYIIWFYDQTGIAGGAETARLYLGDTKIDSWSTAVLNQVITSFQLDILSNGGVNSPADLLSDNIKTYEFASQITEQDVSDIIGNKDKEGFGRKNRFNLNTEETMEILILSYTVWNALVAAKTVYYQENENAYQIYFADGDNIALSKAVVKKTTPAEADQTDFETNHKPGGTLVASEDEAKSRTLG